MDKEFETWWTINKFRLMENVDVGLREIAHAAYLAGRQAAQQNMHPTYGESAAPMQWTTPEDFTPPVVRLVPPISG